MERNDIDTRRDAFRILVVEHHPMLAASLMRYLEQSGYGVVLATSARSAWAALQTGDFDVLLTDVWLPDGICVGLVQHGYPRRPRFVVTMSAFEMPDEVLEGWGCAWRHLVKPFDPRELDEMLESFASERALDGSLSDKC